MEMEKPLNLLNADGSLNKEGWARHQVWNYDRHLVAMPTMMLKEWNRFLVIDKSGRWMVLASASQIGTKSVYSISYADLASGTVLQERRRIKANDSTRLPLSADVDSETNFSCDEMRIAFIRRGDTSNLLLSVPSFDIPVFGHGIDARFELSHERQAQSYTTAQALSKSRKSFLLNRIETCIPVSGVLRRGNATAHLSIADDVYAVFDWGRGRFSSRPMTKAVFCGKAGDSLLGLSITTPDSCALTIDGVTHVFGGLKTRNSKDGIRFESKGSKVCFNIHSKAQSEDSGYESLFGHIEGTAELSDGKTLDLNGISGMVLRIGKNR